MKIRRLPEIDLARIAPLPADQKRLALENFRLGRPTIRYEPVRTLFTDIFNVQPELFGIADPTAWPVLERLVQARATSEEELVANLFVAKGLHTFAQKETLGSRSHDFFPMSLSVGEKVAYWLPLVAVLKGVPMVLFIDPRRGKRLTAAARRFVFSMMNEHIRIANPDFANVRLGIIQLGEVFRDERPARLWTDESVDLFGFHQLDQMVRETYEIWREVSERRDDELRRKTGGGHGPLFGTL